MNIEAERKRLVELINNYPCMSTAEDCFMESISDDLADYLIANGIVVPPVKVGDKVYQTVLFKDKTGFVVERNVVGFHFGDFPELRGHKRKQYFIVYHETTHSITHIDIDQLGKTVFTSREEAEKMLNLLLLNPAYKEKENVISA